MLEAQARMQNKNLLNEKNYVFFFLRISEIFLSINNDNLFFALIFFSGHLLYRKKIHTSFK